MIKISERQLVVEVNSTERAEKIRKIIEELLESLLLEYEINNERAGEFNRADIPAIRKELGMK